MFFKKRTGSTIKMYNFVTALFVTLFCYHAVFMSPVHEQNSSEDITEDVNLISSNVNEVSGEINDTETEIERIEEIKSRILKSLHRKEPPKTHAPLPVLQSLNFTSELSGNETLKLDANEKENIKSEFLPSVVDNTSCIDAKGYPCVRVSFNNLQLNAVRGGELWLFKNENVSSFSITHIISIKGTEQQETSTTVLRNQTFSKGWLRFDVLPILLIENITALEFQISSENSESILELGENTKPFLLTHIVPALRSISKRSPSCSNTSGSCCLHSLFIKFEDINYSEWIIHPDGYQANFCDGTCDNNIGLPVNHHAQVFMALCQNNPQKFRETGKAQCLTCVANAYEPVSIIYLNEEGVQVVSKLPGMSVVGCGCA